MSRIDQKRKRCLLKEGKIKNCIYAREINKRALKHKNIMEKRKRNDIFYCPANGCLALRERETLGFKEET